MPLPLKHPIDYNDLRTTLIREVQKVSGLICVVTEPETTRADRPSLPYFSLKITTPGARYGDDSMSYVSGTTFNRGGPRKMTVSFNCYGTSHEEAYGYMAAWQGALDLQTIQEDLRRKGIAVWIIGNVADLSQLLNTGYEGRAQMDVQFGIASNMTEDLSDIDSVTISGEVSTPATTVDVEVDVDAP